MAGAGAEPFVNKKLQQRKLMMFSKTYSPECKAVKAIFSTYPLAPTHFEMVEIEKRQDCTQIENYFQTLCLTNNRAVSVILIQ